MIVFRLFSGRLGRSLACSVGLLVALSAACAPTGTAQVEVVRAFDPAAGEHPEAVVRGPDGTIYVGLHEAAALYVRDAGGDERTVVIDGAPAGTRVNGLALLDDTLFAAVRADDEDFAGVWRFDDAGAARVVTLPAGAGLNGMDSLEADGLLFITDDQGAILRVRPDVGEVVRWAEGAWLEPTDPGGYGAASYGANGIAVQEDAVSVSLPAHGKIVRLPILADGSAGEREETYPDVGVVDDFGFGPDGTLLGAALEDDEVVLVGEDGERVVLAARGDGVDQPTDVVFGVDENEAWVSNGAFWRLVEPLSPSLMRITW